MIFETDRLIIRKATTTDDDVEMYYRLWTDPRVMTMVGYPQGLKITRDEIRKIIEKDITPPFEVRLIVERKDTGERIGECFLHKPDETGLAGTDVKLLPEQWGNAFGAEVKQGLVDYLFTHTDCNAIKAEPNKKNIASQKMQEAVGGKRMGEGVCTFPEKMKDYTCDVHYYEYRVFRADWERHRRKGQ
jgi:RimJ/RimL family protein N-acetyltransferase